MNAKVKVKTIASMFLRKKEAKISISLYAKINKQLFKKQSVKVNWRLHIKINNKKKNINAYVTVNMKKVFEEKNI